MTSAPPPSSEPGAWIEGLPSEARGFVSHAHDREAVFRLARLAGAAEARRALARLAASPVERRVDDELVLAGVELAAGDHAAARARLARLPKKLVALQGETLFFLRQHLDLAAGVELPARRAMAALAALPRHASDGVESYAAFLLAGAALDLAAPLPAGLLPRWMRDPADDVRGYAQWLRCRDEAPADEGDRARDAAQGAALARAANRLDLAALLETRAGQLAAHRSAPPGPYRR